MTPPNKSPSSLVRSPGLDLDVADLEPVDVLGLEGPVGRVLEEEVLHQQVARVLRLEEVGTVLLPHLGCNSIDISNLGCRFVCKLETTLGTASVLGRYNIKHVSSSKHDQGQV